MKTNYYILVNQNGNPITKDHKLPIYWNLDVAERDAQKFSAKLKVIKITKLKSIIEEK
jgi:hypothetical protein